MRSTPVRVFDDAGDVAADPTARVLQLLSLLQTHRLWTGDELAARLEVAGRTVRRDVERLRSLGYPVEAVPGPDGGYRLAAGAHLPPLVLDDDEAVAIAVGVRMAASAAITGIDETSLRALTKLEQLLPDRLRRRTKAIVDTVATYRYASTDEPAVDAETLAVVGQACRDAEELRFEYRSRGGDESSRLAQPHTTVTVGRRWYLLAWDRRREDWRTFRLDRMSSVRLAGARFDRRSIPGGDPAKFVATNIEASPRPFEVVVTIDAARDDVVAQMPWLADELSVVDEHRVRFTVRAVDQFHLVSGVLYVAQRFPLAVDDSAPASLHQALRDVAARLESAVPS